MVVTGRRGDERLVEGGRGKVWEREERERERAIVGDLDRERRYWERRQERERV